MKIATYNINSVNARGANLCQWLKNVQPDIVFLQEIKCETDKFLYFECESLGYKTIALGQKSYNGVAILSKYNFDVTSKNLPNFDDDAARYLEILVNDNGICFYAISAYVPNGCSPDKRIEIEKLSYKLRWLEKFYERIVQLKQTGIPVLIGGDFNVMMSDIDVFDESRFKNSPLYKKEVQDKILALQYAGFYDAFRFLHPRDEGFTFWDYTANSFVTNSGLRIDYLFMTAQLAEKLKICEVDRTLRQMEKPSDHTALVAEIEDFDV
ncbi:MAG: exodeoxyribonuclease III [Acetobacter sp.]|nr:exodeoxyribonuclease III [Acetobacter sp.]